MAQQQDTTAIACEQIEQAACTILARRAFRANRYSLAVWVEQITSDPSYTTLVTMPLVTAGADYGAVGDATPPSDLDFESMIAEDSRIYSLATAVVLHRRGAISGEIAGLGGPLAYVSSSLAAAVVQFASDLNNARAIAAQQRDDALEDAAK